MKKMKNYLILGLLATSTLLTSCGDDDVPPEENDEEQITRVTLTFTPSGGGSAVTAVWFDADGEGTGEPTIEEIDLAANTAYNLSIELENTLADDPEEQNITEEVKEEDDEHMFFFGFTSGVFTSPSGDGNIGAGSRNDPMNYLDDDGVNPLGLLTSWETGSATSGATFTVILKHQPPLEEGGAPQKSATSTSETGESDVEIDFVLNIN
ncbi:MAG: hypothetical protein Tsb0034_16330 [Ekhidna sp.]